MPYRSTVVVVVSLSLRAVLLQADTMEVERVEAGRGRPVRCEGYLFKRGQNAFRTWNRRWFYLSNNKVVTYCTVHYLYCIVQLCYSKRNGEDETIIEDDLRICLVRPLTDTDRR